MKRKINNALCDIDQRFIEEAAGAGRLSRRFPVWLKAALPAAGAAAAAAVCIFAANSSGNGGVDLIDQPSADPSASYSDILPAGSPGSNDNAEDMSSYPQTMELLPPEKPLHSLVMYSDKPKLLYADENTALFTALGRCVYLYDFREGRITQHADVYAALKNELGNSAAAYQKGNISFGAMPDGTPVVRYKLEIGAVSYAIDDSWSSLERIDGEYEMFIPEHFSENTVVNENTIFGDEYIRLSDGSCITITNSDSTIADDGENGLRVVTLSRFTLDGDAVNCTGVIQPFDDEYLESLTVRDEVTSYRYYWAYLDFDASDGTFELWTMLPLSFTPCGSYAISGNDITLTFDGSGSTYTGSFTDNGRGISFSFDPDDDVFSEIISAAESMEDDAPEAAEALFSVDCGQPLISGAETGRELPDGTEMQWPVGGDGGVITEMMYGHGGYYKHKGIDIAAPVGTSVLAAGGGTVILAEWYEGYGQAVVIDHGGILTLYSHLSKLDVEQGQQVSGGDIIGEIGTTGLTSDPQLHFEVRKGDLVGGENLNPTDWLPEHEISAWTDE